MLDLERGRDEHLFLVCHVGKCAVVHAHVVATAVTEKWLREVALEGR